MKIKINDLLELSKFTDILKSDITVLTPSGYRKIYDVAITAVDSDIISLKAGDLKLNCSPDHRVKSDNIWIKAKDLNIGDDVNTKYGHHKIDNISLLGHKDDLVDLHVDGNEYYTNDIVSHNSSLLDSVDFSLYGKVRGRKKKWATLATLPNRINGELLNRIKFISNGTQVEIKRGISPNILELIENDITCEKAGKGNVDIKIEKYIGVDIETFKSFISLSINDFKNFISLSNDDKQLLLDKLFNLEVINILKDILKDLNKNNKTRIASVDTEIKTLDDSIESIKRSIDKSIERGKENIQLEIDTLVNDMNSKKEDYKKLKEKVDKIKEKEGELNNELDNEKKQYINIQNDIKHVQREIDLYDSGKCPTCGTDFNSDHFILLGSTLVDKKSKLNDIKLEVESNIKNIKERQSKLSGMSDKTTKSFNDLNYLLRNYKTQIESLTKKKSTDSSTDVNISEFQNTINELLEKKSKGHDNISLYKENELYYKELNRIFGEDGVKKSIISGIIKPINHFISENVKKMGLNFDVKLDETFNAEIKQLGTVIEQESLSTGETKLTNIAILIAYLKLIRTKRHINILFLDEVFSSVDVDNIHRILELLKSFANDYNINIFVVHHAVMNNELFDRVLRIEKNVFSQLIED